MTIRPASRAFLMVGTIALESLGTMAKPLAPAEIRFSIAATWPSLSPSNLPAAVIKLDAELLGLGLGAFAHLDEERIGLGLGDEADDIGRIGRRTGQKAAARPRSPVLS